MTKEQAIALIDQAVAMLQLTRKDHETLMQAIAVLKEGVS